MKKILFTNYLSLFINYTWFRKWVGGNYCKVKYPKTSAFKSGWVLSSNILGGGVLVKIEEWGVSVFNPIETSFRELTGLRHGCDHKYITNRYCSTCNIDFKNYSVETINKRLGNGLH